MSASPSFRSSVLFASLLALVGCSGKVAEPTTTVEPAVSSSGSTSGGAASSSGSAGSSSGAGGGTSSGAVSPDDVCAKRACGVDCTPAGSDEPFNCNSAGKCVATGNPLGCATTCPPFVGDCVQGSEPADLDGDGCIDGCKPKACPPFVPTCDADEEPADANGDGCVDGCKPKK